MRKALRLTDNSKEWRAKVLAANREVHGRLADVYEKTEPHFRPENQSKVKERLARISKRTSAERLLDIGCGTGFILRQAVGVFKRIDGIDITQEMIARIPDLGPTVHVQLAEAEALPFPDATFDVVSAYSVFDHLVDYRVTLREVARVLKPGGIFYADLIPNRCFWQALGALDASAVPTLSDIVEREWRMVHENDKRVEAEFGVDSEAFRNAEPGKLEGGIDAEEVCASARKLGYSQPEFHYDWFLGQGAVMHGQSFEEAAVIETYLERVTPLSRHLFKYIYFVLTK